MKCLQLSQLYSPHLQGLMVPIEIVITKSLLLYRHFSLAETVSKCQGHELGKSKVQRGTGPSEELSQALENQ